MEIIDKVKDMVDSAIRNDFNQLSIPPKLIEMFYGDDPDFKEIKRKTNKLIKLINEAESKGDTEFLLRDFETDVWFIL